MVRIIVVIRLEQDRKTLMALLSSEKDFCVLCAGTDGYGALVSAGNLQPDIIIMEQHLPDIDGMELAPLLKRRSPATALILLSPQDGKTGSALRSEISGYLLKHTDMGELAASVRSVFYGGFYISARMLNHIFLQQQDMNRHGGHWRLILPSQYRGYPKPFELSATECQIISGIAQGRSDKEIAHALHLKQGSVRNCLSGIRRRTRLRTRTQIVLYALKYGSVKIDLG